MLTAIALRLGRAVAPALVLLAACAVSAAGGEIVKSPNDRAAYETLRLANGLRVVLISDPRTDKSAAALAVRVGSGSDPEDRQGLAHFLEHMLFLGTEKYPDAGEYQRFIAAHGGSQNAYTSYEFTTYFFDIDPDYLQPALDRFSQFFLAPLFTPRYVERELKSVEAEYRSKLKDDGNREIYVQKTLLNPEHPYAKFHAGNLDSLSGGEALREELIAFYREHYSADLMGLAVLGKEPLERLRAWAQAMFSAVPNRGAEALETDEALFAPGALPARLNIEPNTERRLAQFAFPIPPVREHYRKKPDYQVAEVLGHEGTGSLLSVLKSKGWVNGLSAGTALSHAGEALFQIAVSLTPAGLEHLDEIGSHVFQAIRLLEREGVPSWIFSEQQRLLEIEFRFQERFDPIDHVVDLATDLHFYPPEDLLRGPYALDVFDEALVERVLASLRPEKLLLTVVAKGLPTDRTERWFQAPYSERAIEAARIEEWRSAPVDEALRLPAPNPFIPENLALKPVSHPSPVPVLIEENEGVELWHQRDQTFNTPHADFFFALRSTRANDSAEHAELTKMLVDLVNDQLSEFSYPASLAGLDYSLYRHMRGISVRISGYSERQERLLARILEALRDPVIDPARFAALKERRLRSLRSADEERPFNQTLSELTQLLLDPSWSEEERIAALEPLTSADLKAFVPRWRRHVEMVALSHGNTTRAEARALAERVETELMDRGTPTPVPESRVVKLEPGALYLRELDVEHDDSALTVYFQGADQSFAERARFALLSRLLSPPFYTELRTERQLGYIVFANLATLLEVPGINFVVQSPVADPLTLEDNVEAFLDRFAGTLAGLADEEFEKQKAGVVTLLEEEDKSLHDRSDRYWSEIDKQQYRFDTRERLVQAVRAIDKADFLAFYRRVLLGAERKRIVVRSVGAAHREVFAAKEDARERVADHHGFKRGKAYFPRA